ncbi:hypothetical protein Cgig2_011121 [Carnegiea gigantea]|uniref:Uncharacterized protein n=1 Tax=Carnegiea gigantea TaxID=171969 RepID=A0A9Q1JUN9_9CARY|nr:hypothetical protein Cgig2_011121 [Carnegiea gigantea]
MPNDKILCFQNDPIARTHVILILDDHITAQIVDLEWPPFLDEGIENKECFDRRISVLGPVNGVYCIINGLVEREPCHKRVQAHFPSIALPMPPQLVGGKWKPVDDYFYHWRLPIGSKLMIIQMITKWSLFTIKVYVMIQMMIVGTSGSTISPQILGGLYTEKSDVAGRDKGYLDHHVVYGHALHRGHE